MKESKFNSNENRDCCVLILGGLGFIGSHLARTLIKRNYRVKIFDKLYGSRELINDFESGIELVEGDAEKSDDIMKALNDADIVVHLIHTTVPASSMRNPAYDVQSNVLSSVRWLSLLNTTKARRIIYVSSGGTVYGIPDYNPIDEKHPTHPICSYGITKLAIENYTALYSNMYDVDYGSAGLRMFTDQVSDLMLGRALSESSCCGHEKVKISRSGAMDRFNGIIFILMMWSMQLSSSWIIMEREEYLIYPQEQVLP